MRRHLLAFHKVAKLCDSAPLKRETNGSPQPFVYFLPYEREQEAYKYIPSKHFRVSGIKISNVVTKKNFPNIAAHPRGAGYSLTRGYIGMCGPTGYDFSAVLFINRVSI